MTKIINVGIIGTGGIANGKHMPSLAKVEGVEMTAFCDIEVEKATGAAATFGLAGAKVYTDYTKLLKDPAIDVVHVLTPNDSHAEITIAALEAGKHVMCEKPMAKKAADARRMVEAAKKSGKKLTIGYQTRHTARKPVSQSDLRGRRSGRNLLRQSPCHPPPRRSHLGRLSGCREAGRRAAD